VDNVRIQMGKQKKNTKLNNIQQKDKIPKKGIIFIDCTIKNTLVTLGIFNGSQIKTFLTISTKQLAETKRFRNNHYTLQKLAKTIINKFQQLNIYYTIVKIKGIGSGRYQLTKHFKKFLYISLLQDRTSLPFNGCRPKKPKRK